MLHDKKPPADPSAGDSPARQASTSSPDPAFDPGDESEAQMRRALGLTFGAHHEPANRPPERVATPQPSSDPLSLHRRKRRFVQEGEVPVVLMHTPRPGSPGPGNRLDAAEAAATAERLARERAERSLQEAQALVRDLQTKQGHAELARREALATAEARLAELASLRAALAAQEQRAEAAEAAQAQAERAVVEADAALRGERSARKAAEAALRDAVAAREAAEARLAAVKDAAPLRAAPPARKSRAGSAGTPRAGSAAHARKSRTGSAGTPRAGSATKASSTTKSVRVAKQPRASSASQPEQKPVKWWVKPAQPKQRRGKAKAPRRT